MVGFSTSDDILAVNVTALSHKPTKIIFKSLHMAQTRTSSFFGTVTSNRDRSFDQGISFSRRDSLEV